MKSWRGARVKKHGGGRDGDCGSAKPRQGALLCEERNAAASSREATRQSRAARIGDGLAGSSLRLDWGRAMSPRTRHDTVRMANAACFAAVSGAQSRENEASCAGTRPDGVYAYAERSRYAQIARCRGRATLRRNMPHVDTAKGRQEQ